jgi:hypothetical protein
MIDAISNSNDEGIFPEEPQKCSTAIPLNSSCDPLNTENRTPKTSVEDAPDIIPVRMLNEFTYCPRLGYQARLLARTLTGELPVYVPFCTR